MMKILTSEISHLSSTAFSPLPVFLDVLPSVEKCRIDVLENTRDNEFLTEVVRTHNEEENVFGLILME